MTILFWAIAIILVLSFFYNLGKESAGNNNTSSNVNRINKGGTSDAETRRALAMLANALEKVIDDVIGRSFNRQDREKIAVGMIAVMAAESISIERLINDSTLFAAVMLQSIKILTESGEIHVR